MSNVKRVYVEKKSGFDVQAKELKTETVSYTHLTLPTTPYV